MIDVVYILGSGSTVGNAEIKYSLRSIEKHLKDYGNVFIIGERPYFLNEKAIEIKFKDLHRNKARNIMSKINRAAIDERVSDNFILFNDDYFLLQDVSAIGYPFYYKNNLKEAISLNIGEYEKHLRATLQVLEEKNKPIFNFDSHYPIIYNKEKVKKVIENYNWNVDFGYTFKSIYCNHYHVKGLHLADCKVSHQYSLEQIKAINKGRSMFSTGEKAMCQAMIRYLKEMFPEKSIYENF